MYNDIKLGISSYFEALGFILRHKLWYFFLFPVLLSVLALVVLLMVKSQAIDATNTWLMDITGFDHEKDDLEGWFATAIRVIVGVLIWVVTTYIFWTMNKYIVLIILSPVLSILSEKTESILTGKSYPFDTGQFLSDILRGTGIAIRNLIIELLILGVVTIIGVFFPLISPVLLVLMFVVSAYFYGYSMLDYNNERHRLTIKEGTRLIRRNRFLAVSNGAFFDLFMRIPVLGITFAPILGCVGATLALHRKYDLNRNLKTI